MRSFDIGLQAFFKTSPEGILGSSHVKLGICRLEAPPLVGQDVSYTLTTCSLQRLMRSSLGHPPRAGASQMGWAAGMGTVFARELEVEVCLPPSWHCTLD